MVSGVFVKNNASQSFRTIDRALSLSDVSISFSTSSEPGTTVSLAFSCRVFQSSNENEPSMYCLYSVAKLATEGALTPADPCFSTSTSSGRCVGSRYLFSEPKIVALLRPDKLPLGLCGSHVGAGECKSGDFQICMLRRRLRSTFYQSRTFRDHFSTSFRVLGSRGFSGFKQM